MNYFDKIEAYFADELSDFEKLLFEQEVEENAGLQAEVEAYKLAADLFDFTSNHLSTKSILSSASEKTADQLLSFVANNLSEEEIIGLNKNPKPNLTIERHFSLLQQLSIAATLLLLIGMTTWYFGIDNYSKQPKVTAPLVQINEPHSVETLASTPIAKTEKADITISKDNIKPRANGKDKLTKKVAKTLPTTPKTLAEKDMSTPKEIIVNNLPPEPIAATHIVVDRTISTGEEVTYQANNTITLKPGFHAKAGASFTANSTSKDAALVSDIAIASTISNKESVVFKAGQSITLKPGFHVEAGADFVATVE